MMIYKRISVKPRSYPQKIFTDSLQSTRARVAQLPSKYGIPQVVKSRDEVPIKKTAMGLPLASAFNAVAGDIRIDSAK